MTFVTVLLKPTQHWFAYTPQIMELLYVTDPERDQNTQLSGRDGLLSSKTIEQLEKQVVNISLAYNKELTAIQVRSAAFCLTSLVQVFLLPPLLSDNILLQGKLSPPLARKAALESSWRDSLIPGDRSVGRYLSDIRLGCRCPPFKATTALTLEATILQNDNWPSHTLLNCHRSQEDRLLRTGKWYAIDPAGRSAMNIVRCLALHPWKYLQYSLVLFTLVGAEAVSRYFSVVDTLQLRLSIREARRAEAEAVAFEHMARQCQEGQAPECWSSSSMDIMNRRVQQENRRLRSDNGLVLLL